MSSNAQRIRDIRRQVRSGPSVIVEQDISSIAPGSSGNVRVKLSGPPPRPVALRIVRKEGDADVIVSAGERPVFTPEDWDTWRTVTMSSSAAGGTGDAVFQVRGAWVKPAEFTLVVEKLVKQVVIDPVTRIEGRLRVEVELDGDTVTDAWSTAALFRGIEPLLIGRAPEDAPIVTQRVCGVCTYVHGVTSVESIESAAGVSIPESARLVRNLLMGAQFLHDHIVHFYHMQGMDWIDVPAALAADPTATQALADVATPSARPMDFAGTKTRLQALVDSGKPGLFAGGHFGHPAYNLSAEENLLLATHYLEALKVQVNAARMMAVLGGKNPHPAAMVPGGVTCGGELSKGRLNDFDTWLADTADFIATVMLPDAQLLAERYPYYATIGGSPEHMVFGGFPLSENLPQDFFFPQGMLRNGNMEDVQALDMSAITEDVARSWYLGTAEHPSTARTDPNFSELNRQDRYSWSKAPRYNGDPMEVGPLSRLLVSLAAGQQQVSAAVLPVMMRLGWGLPQLNSVMGRVVSRAVESKVIADAMPEWSDQLAANILTDNDLLYVDWHLPNESEGLGYGEVPRGALGHWLKVDAEGRIGNYQMVVPSTWNFGPRDVEGKLGPVESALKGLKVLEADRPLEVMRVVHSFDPCIACAVHVVDVRE
jgi:[NiFe] hydrogenase large subunit